MPQFTLRMRCIYEETWSVEAHDEAEARKLVEDLDESVETDEAGECVDWEIASLVQSKGE